MSIAVSLAKKVAKKSQLWLRFCDFCFTRVQGLGRGYRERCNVLLHTNVYTLDLLA